MNYSYIASANKSNFDWWLKSHKNIQIIVSKSADMQLKSTGVYYALYILIFIILYLLQ